MNHDDHEERPVREFSLQGYSLILVVVIAVAVLAMDFYFGRLYERRYGVEGGSLSTQEGVNSSFTNEFDGTIPEESSAEEGLTYFDNVAGGEIEAEPTREARTKPVVPEVKSEPEEAAPVSSGPFYVQVGALGDRSSAEQLVARLNSKGYPVRMHRDATRSLYKILVGGYASREEASPVVETLVRDGFKGAWVTKIDQ